ncbi:hypothetical protein Rs2_24727 [Raphanus sativus]|nr:hypothetical protein Rs2_24727 [Raphanus sativus]
MAPLNVIENVRVSPGIKSSDDSFSLPLTFFEFRWIKFYATQQVMFYRLTDSSSSHESFHSHILPNLKLSLSPLSSATISPLPAASRGPRKIQSRASPFPSTTRFHSLSQSPKQTSPFYPAKDHVRLPSFILWHQS